MKADWWHRTWTGLVLGALALAAVLVLASCQAGTTSGHEAEKAPDAYTDPRRPRDAHLTSANFPTKLGQDATCRDWDAASAHDRSNFVRAHRNLTATEAQKVADLMRGTCQAAIETGGSGADQVASQIDQAIKNAQDTGQI